MGSSGKVSPLLIGIVLLAAFLVFINWPQQQEETVNGPRKTPVKVAQVKQQAFPIVIEALGTARANESVTLTAQETELVVDIKFDDGQYVEAGQLLVQFDDKEERARVNELEVNLNEAKRQLARISNLKKESAASEQLFDEQQARVNAMQAQLEVLNAQLNELQIRAPFSGQLGIREISVGSLVRPADVITTLDDVSVVKVNFSVSESHLASLRTGLSVEASSVAYPGERFNGTISSIDSRIDPVTRSILVRAAIDNSEKKLRPGMLLQITLEKRVLDALVVPEKALVPNEDKQLVYVLNGDSVTETEVKIGERRPGFVQIVSGLEAGQRVVVDGTLRVRDQSSVNVLNDDEE
ncbi:efflux RND transporter periplasmic adaptor subunit [Alteromonas sediminis]|uniref:Efflux RND transporter periplasmic adaptor subunit n=1 Tax=Alteromonas sediminis TaxID=2259342 RepID=A0A3N5Z657_9ALTE|nr:efflux RND transporter periplasmic adaptor subunit [Alteromonas sediminis]RPJ65984.1 efflux RND transporter periplasmic adaptor subunit [Alteromonas sediminis]